MPQSLADLFSASCTLIPVVVLEEARDAVPLARALYAGGVHCIEVTLRTPAALPALEAIAREVPEMTPGAGTLLSPEQMDSAQQAGARFHVSPGITPALAEHASTRGLAWLPGTANATDIMHARAHGYHHVKFFPAGLNGGAPALKQLASVFTDMQFCPTGGVNAETMPGYLALAPVFAIGGSWLTPAKALATKDWAQITEIAQASLQKLRAHREAA